ncbi:ferredoxin, partial [Methylobacterium radiotolerans]
PSAPRAHEILSYDPAPRAERRGASERARQAGRVRAISPQAGPDEGGAR